MSEVFNVSRSGYYKWLHLKDEKAKKKQDIGEKIKKMFETSKSTYGSPRVCQALNEEGVEISKSTVARRMQELEITPKLKKRFKNTTDSNHGKKISPNLLDRQFKVSELGKFWVGDITLLDCKIPLFI